MRNAKRALQALRDGVLCAQQRYVERHHCWRAGQYSAQFAVLIGIVATAAIIMQSAVRRAVEVGIVSVSDQILGPDDDVRQLKRKKDKDVSSVDLSNPPRSSDSVTIAGDQGFKRVTTVSSSSVGANVNESCETRVGAVTINCNAAQ